MTGDRPPSPEKFVPRTQHWYLDRSILSQIDRKDLELFDLVRKLQSEKFGTRLTYVGDLVQLTFNEVAEVVGEEGSNKIRDQILKPGDGDLISLDFGVKTPKWVRPIDKH